MSFIKNRKNILSKKLKSLIVEFNLLKKSKINLNTHISFYFLDIFMNVHKLLATSNYKIANYYQLIDRYILEIKNLRDISKNFGFEEKAKLRNNSVKDVIDKEYYGILFKDFSNYHYYKEPLILLKKRLKVNNFNLNSLKGKSLLDYGCGAGRYTQAFAKLGCKEVLGIDLSTKNIATAKKRNKFQTRVTYKVKNVNKNNIKSNSFDFIFCNGVLHHTGNISKGLLEIHRILKPGGKCIMYLSSTDGIKWYFIEAFREIVKNLNREQFAKTLRTMNLKYNKIFYLMDHVFVKYNHLTTEKEVKILFKKAKLNIVQKFNRGHSLDDTERYHQLEKKMGAKIAFDIYGYGEHRYILSKK